MPALNYYGMICLLTTTMILIAAIIMSVVSGNKAEKADATDATYEITQEATKSDSN